MGVDKMDEEGKILIIARSIDQDESAQKRLKVNCPKETK